MSSKTSGILIGILLILYGLFRLFLFDNRDIIIGIAFVFYGIGTILTSTKDTKIVRIGIIIEFLTLILLIIALLYEKFG